MESLEVTFSYFPFFTYSCKVKILSAFFPSSINLIISLPVVSEVLKPWIICPFKYIMGVPFTSLSFVVTSSNKFLFSSLSSILYSTYSKSFLSLDSFSRNFSRFIQFLQSFRPKYSIFTFSTAKEKFETVNIKINRTTILANLFFKIDFIIVYSISYSL